MVDKVMTHSDAPVVLRLQLKLLNLYIKRAQSGSSGSEPPTEGL